LVLSSNNPKFFDNSCGRDAGQDSGNLPRADNGNTYYQQGIQGDEAAGNNHGLTAMDSVKDFTDGIQKDIIRESYAKISEKYQNTLKWLAKDSG
jgi:hypothetical protein